MANRSNPVLDEARRLCAEFPNAPNRTLAKRLASTHQVTVESARGRIRSVRGARGIYHRKAIKNQIRRPKGKAGTVPKMPPSAAESWEPHTLHGKRILCLSDIHIPYHSELALAKAVEHGKTLEPDTVLLNGDFCDFYTISRWIKNPKHRNFKAERQAVVEFLQWLRHEFLDVEIVAKKGNHEERWDHWLWNHAPEISDEPEMLLEHWLKFDDLAIEMVDKQRPVMAGKLPVLHGHELPKGLTNPVNMARGAFLRMVDTVLVGHGHRSSSHTESTWTHKEITCWSQGCLCDLTPEYARINKWNWGFAFIEVADGGDFQVSNFRINKEGKVRKS